MQGLPLFKNIPRPGLSMGATYFSFSLAIGSFLPYITLYYRQVGLSGSQIGLLTALPPLATALLAPMWGMLTDIRGAHRVVLRVALLLTAGCALLLTQMSTFVQIVGLVGLLAISASPVASLLESFGITISARYGLTYGRLRVWGSAGYILASFGVGLLMGGSISRLFLVLYALGLLVVCAMSFGLPTMSDRPTHQKREGVRQLLRQPAILVLLVTTYLMTLSASTIFSFLAIHIADLGGGTRLVGLANAFAAGSEMPVLLFGATLSARLGSRRMIIMALLFYVVRYVCYSLAPGPGWILLVQLLHGLSFGANLIASVALAHQLAGADLAATAQGLLASAFAFGAITGSLTGGALLDRLGTPMLYRIAAVVSVLGLIIFIIGSRRWAADESNKAPVATSPAQP